MRSLNIPQLAQGVPAGAATLSGSQSLYKNHHQASGSSDVKGVESVIMERSKLKRPEIDLAIEQDSSTKTFEPYLSGEPRQF